MLNTGVPRPRRGRARTYRPLHAGGDLGRGAASSLLPKRELMKCLIHAQHVKLTLHMYYTSLVVSYAQALVQALIVMPDVR